MPQRNYLGAIETLNQYQTPQTGHPSTKPEYDKLQLMRKYLKRCGISVEQLDKFPIIHVTGTHGKGSTCFYCENIIRGHGYKTGFYSSPHLLEVRERIRIGGRPISKATFSDSFWTVYDLLDKEKEDVYDMPLYFPFLTILAFYIFLKSEIDVVIVEVGIGGEYDCTNVIRSPTAVGIAPISIDHTAQLGISEESIAWHKAGIMKPGSVAYSVPQSDAVLNVLFERSKEKECPLTVLKPHLYKKYFGSRVPVHIQESVAVLAIALSKVFIIKRHSTSFSLEMAIRIIEDSCWPGRYDVREIRNIRFFLDGAHTQNSINTTANWFSAQTKNSPSTKVLIFNLTGKRDPTLFLKELQTCKFDVAIFMPNIGKQTETADTANFKLTTQTQLTLCEEYKQKWAELQAQSQKQSETVRVFPCFTEALRFLGQSEPFDVLVTGSLYLVGAVLSVLDPTLNNTLVD